MSVFQKVRGWIGLLFSIGIDGPQIAWDSAADASADRAKMLRGDQTAETSVVYSKLAGADPTAAQDFVTKTYGDTNYSAATSSKAIEIPLVKGDVSSTVSSTTQIPAGARVISVRIRVDEVFDNADNTVTVGNTAQGANGFADTSDSKLNKLGTYELPQYTDNTVLDEVDAVVAGTASPVGGIAFILIEYVTPAV
jgi:hypothetical protein